MKNYQLNANAVLNRQTFRQNNMNACRIFMHIDKKRICDIIFDIVCKEHHMRGDFDMIECQKFNSISSEIADAIIKEDKNE